MFIEGAMERCYELPVRRMGHGFTEFRKGQALYIVGIVTRSLKVIFEMHVKPGGNFS